MSARANGSTTADDPQRIIDEKNREISRLRHENERLERERDRLRRENERLKTELEAARRAGKRQAAPFSKGGPVPTPKRPGRKAGRRYGRRATRPLPPRIDETIAVPAPATCPHCTGVVEPTHTASQLQVDVPVVRPIVREFQIGIGYCRQCGRRVQGRHPLQTSDALGAAAHQIGPQALALTATLHTVLGVPYAKIARFFTTTFGLTISRSTLCRALTRLGTRAGPTYTALTAQVRESPRVSLDETGWKVAARLEWLWVAVTPETTVYRIQPGRGFDEAAALIGADYAGVIVRDGWAPYRRFTAADHQTCLAHLLRRCHALIEILAIATGRLLTQLVQWLDAPPRHPALRRLARHLDTELTAIFTFLVVLGTDATTWRAEQAIRPAVILRKVCGGNRSPRGARTHEILATVLQTAHQRHLDPHPILTQLLHAPAPGPAPDLCPSRPLGQ